MFVIEVDNIQKISLTQVYKSKQCINSNLHKIFLYVVYKTDQYFTSLPINATLQ